MKQFEVNFDGLVGPTHNYAGLSFGNVASLNNAVLESAAKQSREIFLACCSASSMWTANAATVSPSADTADGRVHFTPANLTNKFHRSLEPQVTGNILRGTFAITSILVTKVQPTTRDFAATMVRQA